MDELDLLKQDWKKQEESLPKLSYNDIYKMLWKKSSSIVKWIFVISILEFVFWGILNILLADGEYWERLEHLHLTEFTIGVYIITYGVTFYFIYRFYRNYREISALDDAKTLMKKILSIRKTVKLYIGYIIISTIVTSIIYSGFYIYYHGLDTQADHPEQYNFTLTQWLIFGGVMIIGLALFTGLIWLFYRIVYGILLKRLYKNYKELRKLEL